jgi:hypothetical protein
MKSPQKVTRLQLRYSQKDETFLFGIVSAEPDYKLALALNSKFSISLKSSSPVKITDTRGSDLIFSSFSDLSDSPARSFSLITNRSGKNFLLKQLKNIDYIFQVRDHYKKDSIKQFISALREPQEITAVFSIDLPSIKDKNIQYLIQ